MENKIILSPEELYYLGSLLQAKYIDYAYVAAMGDIKQNYALFEKETRASLVSAGILMEDFSGNMELDDNARRLLTPVFFGEIETSVNICSLGNQKTVSIYMFHFHDGVITCVHGQDGKLTLATADQRSIRNLITELLPAGYNEAGGTVADIQSSEVTRFIAVKSANLSSGATVKTFLEANGVLYMEQGEQLVSISADTFTTEAFQIVKGV